ncbi:Lipase at C-terminar half [Coccomyxa sp. Obi]|nr:Lipase at C-terminar half [Coccomyxa sp. Obi]
MFVLSVVHVYSWILSDGSGQKRPGYRWDKYLTARSHDTEAEIEAEDAAKEDLRHKSRWLPRTTSRDTDEHPLEDDTEERQLLPLWLKGAANDAAASGDTEGAADSSSATLLDELQRMAFPAEQGGMTEDAPLTPFNESALTPLIPNAVMWLVAEAEEKLRNDSWLDLDLAITLAHLQSVAYCHFPNVDAWNCSRCHGRAANFQVERIVYDEGWDLFGYAGWDPRLQAMVVSFRGTDSHSIYNWAENMRYWRTDFKVPFPGSDGSKVHTGFYVSYNDSSLEPNITAAVRNMAAAHPGAPLYVIGHSMGAALATICAMDVKFKAGLTDVRLYTFGSPRVGNDIFANFVVNQTTASWRFTHNRDIVPSWPPQWVGFHHLPREVWQVDFGVAGVLGVCDKEGEDPRCHNSVCYLGLCTSVADHLIYLGSHMYNGSPSC